MQKITYCTFESLEQDLVCYYPLMTHVLKFKYGNDLKFEKMRRLFYPSHLIWTNNIQLESPWPGLFKSVLVDIILFILNYLQVSFERANAYKNETFYTFQLREQRTLRLCIKPHTSKEAPRTGGIYRYFVLGNWSPTYLFMLKRVKSKYVFWLTTCTGFEIYERSACVSNHIHQ